MDPFTHALVGMGIGALSGQVLNPNNTLYCAVVMGAVIPDIDIITKLKGDLTFIRHHRGISHSVGGFLFFSAITAAVVYIDFGGNILHHFLWALAGAFSHGLLDFLNSYGAQIFWPFSKKRCAGNLLMFFDPFFLLLFLPVLFTYQAPRTAAVIALFISFLYLLLRWKMRLDVERFLLEKYNLKPEKDRIAVMPALKGVICWDFLIEKPKEIVVGTLNFLGRKIYECQSLDKKGLSPLVLKALQTGPGLLFRQFTSFYHIVHWEEGGRHIVKLLDLRYKLKKDFFYQATLVFNEDMSLEEAYFHRHNEAIPMDRG